MRSLNYRDLHQEGNRLPIRQEGLFLTGQRDLHQEGNHLAQQDSLAHLQMPKKRLQITLVK